MTCTAPKLTSNKAAIKYLYKLGIRSTKILMSPFSYSFLTRNQNNRLQKVYYILITKFLKIAKFKENSSSILTIFEQ